MHTISTGAAQEFGNTPEGAWLAANAHYFGFILRYPADKTEITGIIYEPWHFRYIGRRHATRMFELGLCLEEYWEQILRE
jgi:D-alanyl-D-alanine carboxypeptidase